MQYVYVLQCKGGRFYTGYSSNLKQRLRQHQHGEVVSTRHRVPVELVYYEACIEKADAKAREKYLKSTYGKQELRKRLKVFFKKHQNKL